MAAVAPAPFERRKKQALYGKSQRTTYGKGNAAFFEDDEEDELAVPVAKKMKTSTAVAALVMAMNVRRRIVALPMAFSSLWGFDVPCYVTA